jgi:hypothetical protein
MIKPEELRIGNNIEYKGHFQTIIGVYGRFVFLDYILKQTENPTFPIEHIKIETELIEPILLSEDILLKCGFEQDKNVSTTFTMILNTYPLSPSIKLYAYLNQSRNVHGMRIIQGKNKLGNMLSINSVHQLQNLCYVLTGEELSITLK